MYTDKKLSELARTGEGRYLLVNVIMRRARDLYSGSKPLVKTPEIGDAGVIGFKEITADRLKVVPRKASTRLIDLAKKDL